MITAKEKTIVETKINENKDSNANHKTTIIMIITIITTITTNNKNNNQNNKK